MSGPMSSPHHPAGMSLPTVRTSPSVQSQPNAAPGSRATMSVGKKIGLPERQQLGALGDALLVDHRAADVVAGRGQEGEGHPAAHHQGVHPSAAAT